MEVGSFSSDVVAMENLMVCSIVEAVVVETLLAAHRSLACLLIVVTNYVSCTYIRLPKTGSLLKDMTVQLNLIDERFPTDNLRRRNRPGPENKDASDTDNDDEDGDDDDDQDDDDAGDEDFSGEEGGDDDDDDEGDPEEDPAANGNGGSDDDDDDDEEGDDDDEGDEDEDDEEEDEEDEDQPPAKKRK